MKKYSDYINISRRELNELKRENAYSNLWNQLLEKFQVKSVSQLDKTNASRFFNMLLENWEKIN